MTVPEIRRLFEFSRWATEKTLESVSALRDEDYFRDLKSSHGGIHGTLAHTYWADWIWLERWRGSTPSPSDAAGTASTLEMLKSRWRDHAENLASLLGEMTDARLAAPLSYRDSKGNPHAEPLYQQMQHAVNHASYHRGQVVTLLRQLGAKPQSTDLITFYRL